MQSADVEIGGDLRSGGGTGAVAGAKSLRHEGSAARDDQSVGGPRPIGHGSAQILLHQSLSAAACHRSSPQVRRPVLPLVVVCYSLREIFWLVFMQLLFVIVQ